MKNLTSLVAIATFAACSFVSARADTAYEPRSVSVRFADLNTASAEGVAVLYWRMKKASEGVCLDLESRSDLSKMERHAECVNLALGTALARVHLPAVTAYAAARGVHLVDASIKVASYK